METKELTDKQKRFIEEYLIDLNATQAAIRAGYSAKHPSQTGYNNLRNPQIRVIIDQKLKSRHLSKLMINEAAVGKLVEIFTSDEAKHVDQIRAIATLNKIDGEYSRRYQATSQLKNNSDDFPVDSKSLLTAIDSFLSKVHEAPQQMTENGFRIRHFDTDEMKTAYQGHADQQQADQYAMQQTQRRDDEWGVYTDSVKEGACELAGSVGV